jgi:hypothetical protein
MPPRSRRPRRGAVPLEEEYFLWLADKVRPVRETQAFKRYWKLYHLLHVIEFTWPTWVMMDENRAADGIALREHFIRDTRYTPEEWAYGPTKHDWDNFIESPEPCSVFEMLVAFAEKLNEYVIVDQRSCSPWFWEMAKNLRLERYDDQHWEEPTVRRIIERLVNRHYRANGAGGLFPVNDPATHGIRGDSLDQRKCELWNQANTYINEMSEREGSVEGEEWSMAT